MLVLTRRVGETLIIGPEADIQVTVLGIKGNQVKIGVNAPKEVPVHREEIYQRIQTNKLAESIDIGSPVNETEKESTAHFPDESSDIGY